MTAIVAQNSAQSHNVPSYPADNQHGSDDGWGKEGGEGIQNPTLTPCIIRRSSAHCNTWLVTALGCIQQSVFFANMWSATHAITDSDAQWRLYVRAGCAVSPTDFPLAPPVSHATEKFCDNELYYSAAAKGLKAYYCTSFWAKTPLTSWTGH